VKGIETGLLCLILAGAAWTDVSEGKIWNWWLIAGSVAGIWCRGEVFLQAALVVMIFAFLLFRMGMMGAGDGKLMAVIAGYLGMDGGLEAIFTGMLIGAFWSLCCLGHGKGLKTRLIYLSVYFMQMFRTGRTKKYCKDRVKEFQNTIPMAPCMAAGTYLYLIISGAAAMKI
jgi:prepilin peptidase CpaA